MAPCWVDTSWDTQRLQKSGVTVTVAQAQHTCTGAVTGTVIVIGTVTGTGTFTGTVTATFTSTFTVTGTVTATFTGTLTVLSNSEGRTHQLPREPASTPLCLPLHSQHCRLRLRSLSTLPHTNSATSKSTVVPADLRQSR